MAEWESCDLFYLGHHGESTAKFPGKKLDFYKNSKSQGIIKINLIIVDNLRNQADFILHSLILVESLVFRWLRKIILFQ
jgi:hypothetical protein